MIRWLALALVVSGPAAAQDADPAAGRDSFLQFCATCHGTDAAGAGPTATVMAISPPDLTTLAADNGGRFPVARVVARIDGRDPVLAHGTPMPVFGPFFEGADAALKTESGQPVMTSRPIVDLVAWLRTIQR